MDDHPTDLVTLEAANAQSENVQKTYGYLNLDKAGLLDRKLNQIVLAISIENSPNKHPIAIYKIGYKTVEIVFGSNDARESAAVEGLTIFAQKVIVSRPRSLVKDKAIYIYGIPLHESSENIRKFVNERLKLKVKSEIKWLLYPNTEIRNGGRSVVVEMNDETDIPGCAYYESFTSKPKKVTLWYPNMPIFCRKCTMKGHSSRDCPQNPQKTFENNFPLLQPANYAMALKSKKNPADKTDEIFADYETLDHPITQQREVPSANENHETAEYWPFYTKNDRFSNFFECELYIDGTKYQSTEQYLFAEKARKVGDYDIADRIMKNRAAAICKQLGESIPWTGDIFTWREFAKEKLYIANKAKYTQNPNLRKFLFKTAPSVLVEASPFDFYWGVGLKKNDHNIQNADKWRGENIMGYLLTDLRDELMKDPNMDIEKPKRSLPSPDSVSQPRKRTSVSSI